MNVISSTMLTLKQAAEFLHVSRAWLYQLTSQGLIKHYKPMGKIIYFKQDDLEAWMQKGLVLGKAEREAKAVAIVGGVRA
jgi:excisionase family DNA binding protein